MRVIYFSRDYTPHDHRFLSALAKTEHRTYYLRLEQRRNQLEDRSLPEGIELIRWAGGRKPFRWRDVPRLLVDLKKVIRTVKPDIIHAGPIQTAAFLAALAGFRPLVSMSWGYDLLEDARRNVWWGRATRHTLRHSSAMVGDCNTIRQKAIAYGMRDERIVTFPWGVDLHCFSPETSLRSNGRVFSLLSTRGWEPIYGVEVIAQAFVLASHRLARMTEPGSEGSSPELRLTMLGNGSQAAELRRIFIQGGVLDQVYSPGQVSQAELPRYYRAADLYVSASHSDGTSISLLEAMACGCPVLVSDIPGNREWVSPGIQGWLFPDGDVEGLAQAIMQAVAKREGLGEMGRAARLLAEQRADWEKNFPELLHAYELAREDR
jgi:glycosyltransferase involved in cell wall biosynthesis